MNFWKDLLLPRDVDFSANTVLLGIKEPKARSTGAKHQAARLDVPDLAARLDVPDLIQVVNFAYKHLHDHQPLWPFSGQTLRARFKTFKSEKSPSIPAVKAGG